MRLVAVFLIFGMSFSPVLAQSRICVTPANQIFSCEVKNFFPGLSCANQASIPLIADCLAKVQACNNLATTTQNPSLCPPGTRNVGGSSITVTCLPNPRNSSHDKCTDTVGQVAGSSQTVIGALVDISANCSLNCEEAAKRHPKATRQ